MSRTRLHECLVALWAVLTLSTTVWAIWQPDSRWLMAWLIFMSGYAIVSTHWAAREGAAPSEKEES